MYNLCLFIYIISIIIQPSFQAQCKNIVSGFTVEKKKCFKGSLSDDDRKRGYDACCHFEATVKERKGSMCIPFYRDLDKINEYLTELGTDLENASFDCSSNFLCSLSSYIYIVFIFILFL